MLLSRGRNVAGEPKDAFQEFFKGRVEFTVSARAV
jgi:hypothetical protein